MAWDNCTDVSKLENYFQSAGSRMFGYSTEDYFINLRNEKDYLLAYNLCAPLKAIVGKRAKAFNAGTLEILNKNTNNFAKGYEANSLKNVLANPNPLQTYGQFMTQQNIYVDIFGYCPMLVMKPEGIEYEVSSLWNIPPWLFDITYTNKWLKATDISEVYKAYYIHWMDKKYELDFKNLKFIFDDGIGTENDCNLTIPDSRLTGLEYPVSNIIGSYKSRNTLITKRGAIGILSNTSSDHAGLIPIDKDEKDTIQNDFKKYGLVGQPFQVIVTDAALQWQQIGFPTKDLMLFEEVEDSVNRVCDSYDFPPELISRSKSATMFSSEGKKELRKMFYTDAIIPESKSRMEQFSTAILGLESRFLITRDYSKLDVLQLDQEAAAKARKALNDALKIEYDSGLITKNDWLEELGRDRVSNPEFDEYKSNTNENDAPTGTSPEIEE